VYVKYAGFYIFSSKLNVLQLSTRRAAVQVSYVAYIYLLGFVLPLVVILTSYLKIIKTINMVRDYSWPCATSSCDPQLISQEDQNRQYGKRLFLSLCYKIIKTIKYVGDYSWYCPTTGCDPHLISQDYQNHQYGMILISVMVTFQNWTYFHEMHIVFY
jgi:hypothetical protein